MKVKFVVTSVARLSRIAITSGQVIVTLDQIGYYYDFGGNRYKVNDGGSYVTFESDLDTGTKVGSIEIDGQVTDIYAPSMPVDLGELENDLNFITALSDDLINYYTVTESYTKAEVNEKIDALGNIGVVVVDELPTEDISTRMIYLVPRDVPPTQSVLDEWINTDGTSAGWEHIGDTDLDVSDLATDEEVEEGLVGHALASSIPTATSELENDSDYASDVNYVHTDNNVTDADRQKFSQLANVSVTARATEGREIASITCDGVTTTLRASLGLLPRVLVSSESGAVVSAEKDSEIVAFTEISEGLYKGSPTDYGIWNIVSSIDGVDITDNIDIDEVKTYLLDLYHASALLIVRFPQGNTGYFGKYGDEPAEVPTNPGIITATSGTYVATTEYNGVTYTVEYVVDGTSDVIDKFCPDPNEPGIAADAVATWLMYGNVTGTYVNLSAVLNDTAALKKLMNSNAAVDYMLKSTSWMSAIKGSANALQAINASNMAAEKMLCNDAWNEYLWNHSTNSNEPYYRYLTTCCPNMTSDTTPSGRVIYDSQLASNPAYAPVGMGGGTWIPEDNGEIHYLGYDFERDDLIITNVVLVIGNTVTSTTGLQDIMIQGSRDGIIWEDVEICHPELFGTGTKYPIFNYSHPSALKGYRAVRGFFVNGPVVPGTTVSGVGICNIWAHHYNNAGTLVEKTWNVTIIGSETWTDGTNIYNTHSSDRQYVLNKVTGEWEPTTWDIPLGTGVGNGEYMWTDGDHTYYSSQNGTYQYVLNKDTNNWDIMSWQGVPVEGRSVWTDGSDYYFSKGSSQYILDKSTNTWNPISWGSLVPTDGSCVWTDGENTYYSVASSQSSTNYVLNKTTHTWETKTWNIRIATGFSVFIYHDIVYYVANNNSYMLNKTTGEWESFVWNVSDSVFLGSYFWSDGEHIYLNSRNTSVGYLSYIWIDPK